MMRVVLAPKPPHFDALVRDPGLRAIAELVGEEPTPPRPGPKRKKICDRREEIPAEAFPPIWRDVISDLLRAYNHICGYTCLYIERVTGAATVDHMIAKAKAWDQVYSWENYRLVCALMNSRKKDIATVLDPFEVGEDWFALEPFTCQVIPGLGAVGEIRERAEKTLRLLRLNDEICRGGRQEYVESYQGGEISLSYLQRRAPFIARELRRQGRLRPEDL